MKLLWILADMKLFNNNQIGVGLPSKYDYIAAMMSKTWKCPVERWSFGLVHWMGHENNILSSRCVLETESPFKIALLLFMIQTSSYVTKESLMMCYWGMVNGDPSLVFNTIF